MTIPVIRVKSFFLSRVELQAQQLSQTKVTRCLLLITQKTLNVYFTEGAKEEEEKRENQKQTNEKCSENIEVIDVEMESFTGTWNNQNDHIPATPIFHGGKTKDAL